MRQRSTIDNFRRFAKFGSGLTFAIAITFHAEAQTASGVGAQRCSAFLTAAEQQSTSAVDSYISWAQGFISGFNWSHQQRAKVSIDHTGLTHWLLTYCTSNKYARFYEAVQNTINTHAH